MLGLQRGVAAPYGCIGSMAHTAMELSAFLTNAPLRTRGWASKTYQLDSNNNNSSPTLIRGSGVNSSILVANRSEVVTSPADVGRPSIHRKLIWFHHIKSSRKKKHILEWGRALKLGGFCKPGFPGVLIFEGQGDEVADYVKRIKRLRWQHIQVRGEEEEPVSSEDQTVDSIRRFPLGIQELPESAMSELAEECRAANLEPLFLTAFKISR